MSIKVTLVNAPDEMLAAKAALVCTSDVDIHVAFAAPVIPMHEKVLENVIDRGHSSVVEHVPFTFAVSGISRACSHQLVRHRLASYSQQSQRYVRAGDPKFCIPPSIEKHPQAKKSFLAAMKVAWGSYQAMTEVCGIPQEDARFVLPNAAETQLVMTMNARELLHFFSLRCCRRAQWEIRELADQMLALCQRRAPIIFAEAGRQCSRLGACPEGKYSCGLYAKEVCCG